MKAAEESGGHTPAGAGDENGPAPALDVLAPWGLLGPPPPGIWTRDMLGAGFQSHTIALLPDDEGEAFATLVRHLPDQDPVFHTGYTPWLPLRPKAVKTPTTVLYLHGRNDYFFQVEMARQFSSMGVNFYALDLRKYGRSLRPHQTIGWTEDLSGYDEEIGAAVQLIRTEHEGEPLLMMGHSAGGLVATLWAYRHPGALDGLILNSAWLELQTMAAIRPAVHQVVGRLAARRPRTVVSGRKGDLYGRSLAGGWLGSGLDLPEHLEQLRDDPAVAGWTFAPEWKRLNSYPVPAGWLDTILDGHSDIAEQAKVDCPVLNFCSTASASDEVWSPLMFEADVVLDPDVIAARAAGLSNEVTIIRLPGRHDLALSDPHTRAAFYRHIGQWLATYVSPRSP